MIQIEEYHHVLPSIKKKITEVFEYCVTGWLVHDILGQCRSLTFNGPSSLDMWPLKMRPLCCVQTLCTNHPVTHNISISQKNGDSTAQLQEPKILLKGPCYLRTSEYENDSMCWPYQHSGYKKKQKARTKRHLGGEGCWDHYVIVLKIALFSKENMQVIETLRVRILPNLSFTVLCMYAQNNI
jgi:hypothetical protein